MQLRGKKVTKGEKEGENFEKEKLWHRRRLIKNGGQKGGWDRDM